MQITLLSIGGVEDGLYERVREYLRSLYFRISQAETRKEAPRTQERPLFNTKRCSGHRGVYKRCKVHSIQAILRASEDQGRGRLNWWTLTLIK